MVLTYDLLKEEQTWVARQLILVSQRLVILSVDFGEGARRVLLRECLGRLGILGLQGLAVAAVNVKGKSN